MNKSIFQSFRRQSLNQLKSLKPSDIIPFQNQLIPENYTIVARPDQATIKTISSVIKKLKKIDSTQFYYPIENLHLTITGNIPIDCNKDQLIQSVEKNIQNIDFSFQLKGMGGNGYCASFSAYPNFSIHQLRDKIRKDIGFHGDDYGKILNSYEYVGWINILRYLRPPKKELINFIYQQKDKNFGILSPPKIQIYQNSSRILDPSKIVLNKEFVL